MKDQLDLLKKRSGIILREATDLRLRNWSLEASVRLGCSVASNFRARVVGIPSSFGDMINKEMDRTRGALAVTVTASVAEMSDNVAQVLKDLSD